MKCWRDGGSFGEAERSTKVRSRVYFSAGVCSLLSSPLLFLLLFPLDLIHQGDLLL